MAPPSNVKPAYSHAKWWKEAYYYTEGLKVQTQSPYRGDHVTPFLKHVPISLKKKVMENWKVAVPTTLFFSAVFWWGDHAYHQEQLSHRS